MTATPTVPVPAVSDEEITREWNRILAMNSKRSRLAKLLASSMADELEKRGVTAADIDRLFPPAPPAPLAPPSPVPVDLEPAAVGYRARVKGSGDPWMLWNIDDRISEQERMTFEIELLYPASALQAVRTEAEATFRTEVEIAAATPLLDTDDPQFSTLSWMKARAQAALEKRPAPPTPDAVVAAIRAEAEERVRRETIEACAKAAESGASHTRIKAAIASRIRALSQPPSSTEGGT